MRTKRCWKFLSTPSARRATKAGVRNHLYRPISIHALREEGDLPPRAVQPALSHFYPRPPRGGRRRTVRRMPSAAVFLSTPSARRATQHLGDSLEVPKNFYPRPPRGGRPIRPSPLSPLLTPFLSTPSARRATKVAFRQAFPEHYFYPRPPRGGRRKSPKPAPHGIKFLSTPSARRATLLGEVCCLDREISIHALREEGDPSGSSTVRLPLWVFLSTPSARRATASSLLLKPVSYYFYPRPPRGGRQKLRQGKPCLYLFLSTPSARRATGWRYTNGVFYADFYPRPPRGGRPAAAQVLQRRIL